MKIILKSILVSLFILFVSVNLTEIAEMKGVHIENTLDSNQVFETMTYDSKDNSYIFIFSDTDNVFHVRKVSKSFETVWETKLEKAPKEEGDRLKSISIIVDSINDSIFISGTFIQGDDSVVLVMKLDSKQGKIKWRTNLGTGYQLKNNNIGLDSQNKSIFTIKNREYNEKGIVKMHLIKLDSEEGFVLKRNVKEGYFSYEYHNYESLLVNSKNNMVYVYQSYYDNYGGRDMTIWKFDNNFSMRPKEIKFFLMKIVKLE